ncbi:hypothetical protein [Novosphingobium sp. MMS21-SN21R]|uniref:hypothetical protein n=1 Tax=Novosphingobium sp. MMS21-SN21R TaxID=2969298 RepID=UPI0028888540|nr:hypothetical protein [Novosphingobium sp. MMS21-SN21R]MDT0507614.1 hypothetical protein [Novosphingobium sp. MMS21-SN21R]
MSDVDVALHPQAHRNIDRRQIAGNQPHTLVEHAEFAFLRFVNVGRFAAVHQADHAMDEIPVCEGQAIRGAGQLQ